MAGHRAPCTRQVLWGHWARCWGALSPAPQLLLMRAIPSLEWRKSTFLQFVFVTAASLCAQLAVLEFSVLSPQLSLLRSSAEEYGCDERLKASAAALTHSIPSHLLNPASCRGDTPHTTRTGTQRSQGRTGCLGSGDLHTALTQCHAAGRSFTPAHRDGGDPQGGRQPGKPQNSPWWRAWEGANKLGTLHAVRGSQGGFPLRRTLTAALTHGASAPSVAPRAAPRARERNNGVSLKIAAIPPGFPRIPLQTARAKPEVQRRSLCRQLSSATPGNALTKEKRARALPAARSEQQQQQAGAGRHLAAAAARGPRAGTAPFTPVLSPALSPPSLSRLAEMSSSCALGPRSAHKHHPPLSASKSISSPLPQIGPPEKGKPPLVCNHLHPAQTLLHYQLRPGTSSQKKNPHKTAFITADPTTAQHGPREADK